MQQATGELVEIYLQDGMMGGRIQCPSTLIPAPGQYLLAHDGSDAPLPVPVFSAGTAPGGFRLAPPIPETWRPGAQLYLRGPLGHGFSLPASSRCIALAALGETAMRLQPLIDLALGQGSEVVLVSEVVPSDIPTDVEIQLLSALPEVCAWADYLALDVPRESLPGLREKFGASKQVKALADAQILIFTPMPCGSLADCGVCAVTIRHGWKMACKDGPVFQLKELGI